LAGLFRAEQQVPHVLGVFAEFETNLRKERQLEGIAKAKAADVYKGRPASIDPAQVREMRPRAAALPRSPRRSRSPAPRFTVCSRNSPAHEGATRRRSATVISFVELRMEEAALWRPPV
jgi:hypothetical protein